MFKECYLVLADNVSNSGVPLCLLDKGVPRSPGFSIWTYKLQAYITSLITKTEMQCCRH